VLEPAAEDGRAIQGVISQIDVEAAARLSLRSGKIRSEI
jgi:hypothetical protein